jgi:hypothetical protein
MRGTLPKQYDKHYLGLEPTHPDSTVVLTLILESQDNQTLRGSVNFLVLTEDGLRRFLAGADPRQLSIAGGNPLPFDSSGNKTQGVFKASGRGSYTVIVYNDSTALADYTLLIQGGVLIDDAGQTWTTQAATPTPQEQASQAQQTPEAPQQVESALADQPTPVAQVVQANLSPGVVNARRLTGALNRQFDKHYLTLEPAIRDGLVVLKLKFDPQDQEALIGKLNFWVLTEDGVRRMIQGEQPRDLNLATGSPAPFSAAKNELQAAFRATGLGAYTAVMFNDSTIPATYVLTVEGGLLVDRYGQTNEAKAAAAEAAALAPTAVSTVTAAESVAVDTQPVDQPAADTPAESAAAGVTNVSFSPSPATPMSAPLLAGDLNKPYEHHYLGLVPDIPDGRIILTLAYEPGYIQELQENINFWILTQEGLRQVVNGARPADVNIATGGVVRFGPDRGALRAVFNASGAGKYTVIVYNNSNIPASYLLRADGGALEDESGNTRVPNSLP